MRLRVMLVVRARRVVICFPAHRSPDHHNLNMCDDDIPFELKLSLLGVLKLVTFERSMLSLIGRVLGYALTKHGTKSIVWHAAHSLPREGSPFLWYGRVRLWRLSIDTSRRKSPRPAD